MSVQYTLIIIDPTGRVKNTWPVGTAVQTPATDTLAWVKPKRFSETGPVDDGLRLGRWTPDSSRLGNYQLQEIKRLARLSETGPVDDGLRLNGPGSVFEVQQPPPVTSGVRQLALTGAGL